MKSLEIWRCRFLMAATLGIVFLLVSGLDVASQEKSSAKGAKKLAAIERLTFTQWLRQCPPRIRVPEIVEMAWALATGGDLEGGVGWFHPGQSRYGWDWLAARYDKDHDGKITREEFLGDRNLGDRNLGDRNLGDRNLGDKNGPAELFDRLDRDGDGVLTAEDFDWSNNSEFFKQSRPIRNWFRAIDTNSNGRISQDEWQKFFAKAAKGKEYLTPEDLRLMLIPPEKKDDQNPDDEPSPLILLKGFATGELGSIHEGPAIGDKAPEFVLRTQDGGEEFRLSQFHGKKPVVLIFGSFT